MVVYCSTVFKPRLSALNFVSQLSKAQNQKPGFKARATRQNLEQESWIYTPPIWLVSWLNTSGICIPKAPPNILWLRVWVQVRVRHPINVTCLPNWGTLTECFDITNMPLKWNIWKARGVWTLAECFDISNMPLKWNIWKVRGFVNCVIEVP